jgi:hypothetical protein
MREAIEHSVRTPTVIPTPTPGPDPAADERCLMAELSIVRGGYYYYYDGYRYDRLSDAIAYAQLVQGRTRRSGSSAAL